MEIAKESREKVNDNIGELERKGEAIRVRRY